MTPPDAEPRLDALIAATGSATATPALIVPGGAPMGGYLQLAFDNCPIPMLVVRAADGKIIDANPAFQQLTGSPKERLMEQCVQAYLLGDAWVDCHQATPAQSAPSPPRTVQLRRADGREMELLASNHRCDAAGAEAILLTVQTPASISTRDARAPTVDADPLTGLPSRTYFDERLRQALDRVRLLGRPHFAVMFLDLDSFKPVNDEFGHAVGDRVLAAVARRLAAGVRPGDVLSRRGGDEFTLLVESVEDANEARRIAERLWKRAMEPFEVDGHYLHVGASIGIVLGDGKIENPAALIDAADRAMYSAKRIGRPVLHPGA